MIDIVLASGGFDPLHIGHVEYLRRAAELGQLVVALNSDDWLIRKKGYVFMTWAERAAILAALAGVRDVVAVDDADGTVCEAISRLRPAIFAKGGDRGPDNTPEAALCADIGVRCVYGLGGKVQASSGLVARAKRAVRAWGHYDVMWDGPGIKVKALTLEPGAATSLQRHARRAEHWFFPDGTHQAVAPGEQHQLRNDGPDVLTVIEVQTGECEEDDIERIPA